MNKHAITHAIKSFLTKKPKKEEKQANNNGLKEEMLEYHSTDNLPPLIVTDTVKYYIKDGKTYDMQDKEIQFSKPESVLSGKTNTLPKDRKERKNEVIEYNGWTATASKQPKNEQRQGKTRRNTLVDCIDKDLLELKNRITALEQWQKDFGYVNNQELKVVLKDILNDNTALLLQVSNTKAMLKDLKDMLIQNKQSSSKGKTTKKQQGKQ